MFLMYAALEYIILKQSVHVPFDITYDFKVIFEYFYDINTLFYIILHLMAGHFHALFKT